LNAHVIDSLDDACSERVEWRMHGNNEKNLDDIGQKIPLQWRNPGGASSPSLAKEAEIANSR
jgi:hypothetical protein